MEAELLKAAASQGIFAVLFIFLLFYVIKKQDNRDKKNEEREQKLIGALEQAQRNNQQLALTVQKLAEDVQEINYKIDSWGVKAK
ncbi:BhlA/UviB family holin-like peptide [Paenibacillus senegalensis]|uniref:BhlA/UviB family holin-like peptide n=1 Tax=Paenibacillus senegalensis TaxID=1465766 RepID=UPI000289D33D|nr:BhlA/UviB family holin-like peptide [Paenibacillus senegalensis]